MKKYFIIWLSSLLASSHCFAIQHLQFSCPFSIVTKQSIVGEAKGYESTADNSSHIWQTISFYKGKPGLLPGLAPDRSNKNRADWSFSMSDNIYISCGYYQTSVVLFKELPHGVHACHVNYEKMRNSAFDELPQSVSCN